MIEIKVCPSTLAEGFSTYSPQADKALFHGNKVCPILDFDITKFRETVELHEIMHRMSISGVQEKFPSIIRDGKIVISNHHERSTHILKPAPWDKTLKDRKLIPANEHLTMQIASQVYGILTASNGLCFTSKGEPVYITRRFDILPSFSKLHMEDFASLSEKNESIVGSYFKYVGSYEDLAVVIKNNVPAWMVDLERLFQLIVFNYIYANGDAHFKNFSLLWDGKDYRLSPAYDLINTSLHIKGDDFGLEGGLSPNIEKSDVMLRTGHPCRLDFERFGKRIGLIDKRIDSILNQFTSFPNQSQILVEHSFLSKEGKRNYVRIVKERISRFVRHSES